MFPFDDIISFEDKGNMEYKVTLSNGSIFIYDDMDRTARRGNNEAAKDFGWRLKKIMTIKHITQIDLSEMTGLTQATISKYISHKSTPNFENAMLIANTLNCSIDDFTY